MATRITIYMDIANILKHDSQEPRPMPWVYTVLSLSTTFALNACA